MNEDRHTNNIAVIYNEKTQVYSISPLFDQGLCLFSSDFDIQLEAAEELYGTQVKFVFSIRDVEGILKSMAELYSADACNRVKELLRFQIRKYAYLMK